MTATSSRILVVDDEPAIRKFLQISLSARGYKVIEAFNGKNAINLLSPNVFMIILDLGLPDICGFELLRRIRKHNDGVPIIILSGRGEERCKVEALDLGAYDYLTKPFGVNELLARIRTAHRHKLQVDGERPIFRSGELSVDQVRRLVMVREAEIKLTPKAYDLLRILVRHAGKVLTYRSLLQELWRESPNSNSLRVYVRQLRQKIEIDPMRPEYVLTEYGVGYRLKEGELRRS